MSASREKKNRQELSASGIPDIKDIRAQEERQKQRRSNILYGSIAVIFVLVAAALLLWNSNIIQRGATAITVNDREFSAGEVSYYYNNAYNSLANAQYASYIGLDPSKPLDEQTVNDTAKMLLGITSEEEMTYDEFFMSQAKEALVEVSVMLDRAQEENFVFTDEMQNEIDATKSAIDGYAKNAGRSTKSYLKALFGKNMTPAIFDKVLHDSTLATAYQRSYVESLEYTDADLETYYQAHTADFDVVDYEYIYFKGVADPTTDADGKSVPATEEANKAASEKAKAAAEEALSRFSSGESLEDIAEDYEIGTYYEREDVTNSGDTMTTWLFEEGREEGDTGIVENGGNQYLMLFHERERNDYNTVNVRHILCKVDTTGLDTKAEDYNEKLEELKNEQKEKADKLLADWKAAGATEEAFAELANKESDDGGSNTKGGLYEKVAKGYMVPEFNDWIFDDSRQEGDSGIVFAEAANYTGYHVMYFVGEDLPYWKVQVENALNSEAFAKWHEEAVKGVTANEESGLKYVG